MPFDGSKVIDPAHGNAEPSLVWRRVDRLRRWLFLDKQKLPDPGDVLAYPPQPRPLETLQLLTVARALVADRKKWAQGRYETLTGRRCAMGAICIAEEILGSGSSSSATEHLMFVALNRGYGDVETMNDASSHYEMLLAFDEAIDLATCHLIAIRQGNAMTR
jgi:hypothetical protein